jgi:lysophospholipase L1-like esterase
MERCVRIFFIFVFMVLALPTHAQTLTTSNVQIAWKVVNRFRLFKDPGLFKQQETAWRQYGQHVDGRAASSEENARLYYNTSVLGIEHVLNDRRIPFTNILRTKFDWRGWAAKAIDGTCWDAKTRRHTGCGDIDAYINPKSHDIEMQLQPLHSGGLISEYNCEWHVGAGPAISAPCDEAVQTTLPYPGGASISVNVQGERPISIDARVRDLLIVGLGDSFASGEGNPDVPVAMAENRRSNNLYPARVNNDVSGSAQWLDQLCHRSLYSHQLRAALQVAIENPHGAVTFMGYACSGAAVEKGILGPQAYVEYISQPNGGADTSAHAISGGKKDTQLYWLLRELCRDNVYNTDGNWVCPGNNFRRTVDYVFLSVGGNDIGFANLVAWATLRKSVSSRLASFFGATVSAEEFAANMQNILPAAYAKLAKALELAIPLSNGGLSYDPSRVILTAYPDILADETGKTCAGITDGSQNEDEFVANQSLDRFSSWLVVRQAKLDAAHDQLDTLHKRMGELAEANGWTYAGRAYADRPFRGHGFCAQKPGASDDAAEMLMIPCWGKASRPTETCQPGIFGRGEGWRPYNPATQNYPYALRQRWVRSFNDAYMVLNQKVLNKQGQIDEQASAANFSETTGGMHPTAEGHAAMADAILIDLRKEISLSAHTECRAPPADTFGFKKTHRDLKITFCRNS